MKFLRCLFALTLVCALSGMAKATPIAPPGFHTVVVDPSFDVMDLTTTSAVVQFSACDAGQLDANPGNAFVGCETFENETGAPITSLELKFPDTLGLVGMTADCDPDTALGPNFFSASPTCGLVNGFFVLDYTDGSIPVGFPNGVFTIAESGIPVDDFPIGTLTVSPEPSSIWLLSTGALLLGVFFYSKRRNGIGSMGL